MTTSRTGVVRAATATRRGVRDHNMDAATVFAASRGTTVGAIVDGIGNDPAGADTMRLMAHTAARVAATRGPLAGVLAAAALIDDPGTDAYHPDGVLVLAEISHGPAQPSRLAWVGDSHAYSWNGHRLHLCTSPQTMGAYLRQNGDLDLAPHHDNWVRVTLATATATNVALAHAPAGELVLLVSDGLDTVPVDELAALVAAHEEDPQALADAIVAAARPDETGYRDDATAVVLIPGSLEVVASVGD